MGNVVNQEAAARQGQGLIGNPLSAQGVVSAVEAALKLDEIALFGGLNPNITVFSDVDLSAVGAPATVTVTPGGTAGSTSYTYVVADITNNGAAPTAGSTTTGNATLTTANFNNISVTTDIGDTYNVYRSVSAGTPSGLGLIGTFVATANVTVFKDTGIVATAAVIPTTNTTGSFNCPGPASAASIFAGGTNTPFGGKVVVSNATGVTLTAVQLLADVLVRTTGSGAISDATPTAAALVAAAGPSLVPGSMKQLTFRNEGSGVQTITAGSGVTLRTGNTNTIAASAARLFYIVFTTISAGSEAVEIISGPTSAY